MTTNIHGRFLSVLSLFLAGQFAACGAWPAAARAQEAQVAASTVTYNEVPEEIVVKSEGEDKLRTAKPPLKIATDDFESIRKSLEPDKDLFLFESGEFISLSRNYPDKLFTDGVIQPWRAGFSDKTVIVFYPLKKFEEVFSKNFTEKAAKEIQWTLSVTDEEGKIFHKYSGSGLPPESISWTGENDQKEWLSAGHNYAPVYVFVDEAGTPKTVIGEIIKFTAIVFQKGSNLNISLDSTALFGPTKSMKTIDKTQGEVLLSATCDLIKRRYYNMPVKVTVYAQTKDLAELQADQIKGFLKKELMAGESVISAEGMDDSFPQQRIDIVLLNK
ncbi:MAG: hypothetical protein WCW52_01455 [Elusimicrobiales bacterium]|jgi:hypothetical protein